MIHKIKKLIKYKIQTNLLKILIVILKLKQQNKLMFKIIILFLNVKITKMKNIIRLNVYILIKN